MYLYSLYSLLYILINTNFVVRILLVFSLSCFFVFIEAILTATAYILPVMQKRTLMELARHELKTQNESERSAILMQRAYVEWN